jgi:hypothetical protein
VRYGISSKFCIMIATSKPLRKYRHYCSDQSGETLHERAAGPNRFFADPNACQAVAPGFVRSPI